MKGIQMNTVEPKTHLINIVLVIIMAVTLTFLALCSWSLAKFVWPSIFMSIQTLRDGQVWNPPMFSWVLNQFVPLTLLGIVLAVVLKERLIPQQNIKLGINILAMCSSVVYAVVYVSASMSLVSVTIALIA